MINSKKKGLNILYKIKVYGQMTADPSNSYPQGFNQITLYKYILGL